jgi:hypothetical protein
MQTKMKSIELSLREKDSAIEALTYKNDTLTNKVRSVKLTYQVVHFSWFFREISGGDDSANERSELLRLRVAYRLNENEIEKERAKSLDLEARLSGIEEALRTATGRFTCASCVVICVHSRLCEQFYDYGEVNQYSIWII